MKISEAIKELEGIKKVYGDIDCQLEDAGSPVSGYEDIFIVPEKYDSDPEHPTEYWICNIRWWPY